MTVRGCTGGVDAMLSVVDQDTEDLDAVSYQTDGTRVGEAHHSSAFP
ncbi:hypothetical protein ACFWD7_43065 [Streptomyces mirabilis]|nr:hypothetical protein [Streptomyces mirabilis]MCT9112634.1 hypothetical protein [Streptomyces mirabilis]